MEPVALLAELRALADHVPDFASFTPTSRIHHEWLGKVHALVLQWNQSEARSVSMHTGCVAINSVHAHSVSNIVSILYRAIADLELRLPAQPNQVFGPGAVYDFLKTLRDLLASATQSIFIVDPYLDEQIFDAYLATVSQGIMVRLLAHKGAAALKPAVAAFIAQRRMTVEVRCSESIHDRIVFLDDHSCWVLGSSIKDAAKSKPTYLAPLDGNTAQLKKDVYEQIWTAAKPI